MENELVIVRNVDGRPLRRTVFDTSQETVLVVSDTTREAAEAGVIPAIGVPPDGIFELDEAVLSLLETEWKQNNRTEPATWARLRHYRPLRR